MSEKIRVLVVDDDRNHLSMVERLLASYGFEVKTCDTALGVSNTVRHSKPDLVLLDVEMDDLTGDKLLGVARRHAPEGTRFLLYSSHQEAHLRGLAKETGADGWISKSADAEELVGTLETYAGRRVPR